MPQYRVVIWNVGMEECNQCKDVGQSLGHWASRRCPARLGTALMRRCRPGSISTSIRGQGRLGEGKWGGNTCNVNLGFINFQDSEQEGASIFDHAYDVSSFWICWGVINRVTPKKKSHRGLSTRPTAYGCRWAESKWTTTVVGSCNRWGVNNSLYVLRRTSKILLSQRVHPYFVLLPRHQLDFVYIGAEILFSGSSKIGNWPPQGFHPQHILNEPSNSWFKLISVRSST